MTLLKIHHAQRFRIVKRRTISALLAFFVTLTGVVGLHQGIAGTAAAAPLETTVNVEAWWFADSGYKGIAVNVSAADVPEEATQVRITVHREFGGDVVKTSKTTGSVMNSIKAGNQVTAPIVIQPGTYDEAASSSWNAPDAVWTADMVPTSVTVDLLTDSEVLGSKNQPIASLDGEVTGDDVMPGTPTVNVEALWHSAADYKGIVANVSAAHVPDSATQVRVTVHREVGGDVVKTSKTSSGVLGGLKSGSAQSAPIVIQPGTYDEAASSSWNAPNAVWSAETVPTSVTVELLAGSDVIATTNSAIGSFGGVTGAGVMPVAPELTNVRATYHNKSDYKGIAVDFRATGFTDVERITVTVNRTSGTPVVKASKAGAAFIAGINTGDSRSVTTPIVIQPGTYDEGTSSSWFKPVAAWTPTSVPTSVTVTIERAYGANLESTVPINDTAVKVADVMPTVTPPVIVEIPADVPSYEIDVPADAENVTLDLGTPSGTDNSVTIPVQVVVTTTIGISVVFPANTRVTSTDPHWDGTLQLPKVKMDVVVPAASGTITTVGLAIELGSPTGRINFDAPVKLVLEGQAGKSAGYIEAGTFHAISESCPASVPAGMTTDECWTNEGDDLVIWTTHFTTFVSYTSSSLSAGSGGSPSSQLAATGSAEFSYLMVLALGLVCAGGALAGGSRLRRR